MDDRNPAEVLPLMYREVLDVLARLEAAGDRAAAYDLRVRAQRTYATRWDDGGMRALQKIAREAEGRLPRTQQASSQQALARTA
jgi:hypothetical protein